MFFAQSQPDPLVQISRLLESSTLRVPDESGAVPTIEPDSAEADTALADRVEQFRLVLEVGELEKGAARSDDDRPRRIEIVQQVSDLGEGAPGGALDEHFLEAVEHRNQDAQLDEFQERLVVEAGEPETGHELRDHEVVEGMEGASGEMDRQQEEAGFPSAVAFRLTPGGVMEERGLPLSGVGGEVQDGGSAAGRLGERLLHPSEGIRKAARGGRRIVVESGQEFAGGRDEEPFLGGALQDPVGELGDPGDAVDHPGIRRKLLSVLPDAHRRLLLPDARLDHLVPNRDDHPVAVPSELARVIGEGGNDPPEVTQVHDSGSVSEYSVYPADSAAPYGQALRGTGRM